MSRVATEGLALSLLGALVCGCESERALTAQDCAEVRRTIEQAWQRDAVAASHLAERDEYREFIREQGRILGDGWMAKCTERVGRPVAAGELACLERAETIDDVYECAR